MLAKELKSKIESKGFELLVKDLYSRDDKETIEDQRKRYLKILDTAVSLYGDGDYYFISSPGRTEISGNHTDHQRGFVVAAALDIDNVCIVKKTCDNIATFTDDVFGKNVLDLSDLSIHDEEKGNTKSIIRGTAARLKELNYKIGGFNAYQDLRVLVGSGLSSSACFEILITEIYNYLYNDDKISAIDRAIISQWVENNYFGKPCGLMDQMAVSVGSFVGIDFKDKDKPVVLSHKFSFSDVGYELLIIDTKASHADLTSEYAAIPSEMKMVAKAMGKEVLSEVDEESFYNNISDIRKKLENDRAIIRAHHYFSENKRAKALDMAVEKGDIDEVLSIMNDSGNSSYKYLQNVLISGRPKTEAVAYAIAICEKYLGNDGICRVQGGGFAGTIQVLIKTEKVKDFIKNVEKAIGDRAVLDVRIRNSGTKVLLW